MRTAAITPSSICKWKNPSCCSYKWKTNWPLLLISETNVLWYGAPPKRELLNCFDKPLSTFCKSIICHTQNLSRPAAIYWSFCKNNEGKNWPLANFLGLAVIQGRLKMRTAVTPSSIGKWKNPTCCSYKPKTNWPLLLISETSKRELLNCSDRPLSTFGKSKICHIQNLPRPAATSFTFWKNNETENRPLK